MALADARTGGHFAAHEHDHDPGIRARGDGATGRRSARRHAAIDR
jgi:hypothetical protein